MEVARDPECYLGRCSFNIDWYSKIQENGKQIWVRVKNNMIISAGESDTKMLLAFTFN